MQRTAAGADRFDMRPVGEIGGIEPPHLHEGRIEQPQPAIAAEHRDRFGEIVERLALHPDQRVVAALEIEPLGDVVEQVDHAAFRVRRGDDPHGAAARQVPEVFLGFERAVGLVQRRLPLAEVRLVGQPARGAQLVEHRRVGRPLVEERGVEVPQRTIGRVVEGELAVRAEDRHPGGELVERAAVGVDHARQIAAQHLGFGGVDADAGRAARGRHRDHVEGAAMAGDDRRQAAAVGCRDLVGAQDFGARCAAEQLDGRVRPHRRRSWPRRHAHRRH